MAYLLFFLIIMTISISIKFLLKKRIEEVIPISVVLITIIIFIVGIFNNLKLGVYLVEIFSILSIIFNIKCFYKAKKEKKLINTIKEIFTPGLLIYIILYIICISINKDRLFDDYDEYNHWGLILKNMFYYNGYGTLSNSRVTFNEYPPFTACFSYLLLNIKGTYIEELAIVAQNLLYLSFIIPITNNIKFSLKLENIKKTILILAFIIITPLIYFHAFFSNILVDGLLGILFGIGLYIIYQNTNELLYKNIILTCILIAICLIKSIGIFFCLIIIIINLIYLIKSKNTKEIKLFLKLLIIPLILITTWFIKVRISNQGTEWNYKDAVNFEYHQKNDKTIKEKFKKSFFETADITTRQLTLFTVILILIIYSCYTYSIVDIKDKKKYKYFIIAHSLGIIIFMLGLLWMYLTLFIEEEATILACYWRYTSTVMISWTMFNNIIISKHKNSLLSFVILLLIFSWFCPTKILKERFIEREKNTTAIKEAHKEFLTIEKYSEIIKDDKVYFVSKLMNPFIMKINKYNFFDINIGNDNADLSCSVESFANILKEEKYKYVYIYKVFFDFELNYQSIFEDPIIEDSLYKVTYDDNKNVKLKRCE